MLQDPLQLLDTLWIGPVMPRILVALTLLALLTSLPGCGTVVSFFTGPPAGWDLEYVYSGVGSDLFFIETDGLHRGEERPSPFAVVVVYVLGALDLPLSAILDTLLLPVTIPVSLSREI